MARVCSVDEVVRACRTAGWRLHKGRRHWKVYPPHGDIIVVASTPGDHRAFRNICSRLRRAGLPI